MTVTRKNVEFAKRVFVDRLGDPYVYGAYYDAFSLSTGADCSGSAGIFIGAAVRGAQAMSWTRQFTTESFPGPFQGFRKVSKADLLAGNYPIKVCIHHGGGGPNSHMQIQIDGVVMESNGDHGTCTTGTGAMSPADTYWNDWWVLDGPIVEDGTPRTEIPMTLYGPDTSNNNFHTAADAMNFVNQLVGEGFSWISHKVSEGAGFKDAYWGAVKTAAAANNLPCIGYHYVTTENAAAQVSNFVGNGGGRNVMLDFENNSGDIANFWAIVNAFNTAGVNVAQAYIPHWYWQRIGSPDLGGLGANGIALISSAYPSTAADYASTLYTNGGGDNGQGWAGYGGATPAFWQFTDAANIAGKSVDCNAFKGTPAQLSAILGGVPSPAPTPTPAPAPAPAPTPVDPVLDTVRDNQKQLRGPQLTGWPQLNGLTVVDALATIGQHLGIPGFVPPAK